MDFEMSVYIERQGFGPRTLQSTVLAGVRTIV